MLTTSAVVSRLSRLDPEDLPPVNAARETWAALREREGFAPTTPNLMAKENNSKVAKNEPITYTLSLAQHRTSGVMNACTYATKECIKVCVAKNGKGAYYPGVTLGRVVRTKLLAEYAEVFAALLRNEFRNAVRYGIAHDRPVAVRMNTFSDIPWEKGLPWLFEEFPGVQVYDYTKDWGRLDLPANYHLTYSATHRTTAVAISDRLDLGRNVAVVADRSEGGRKGECATTWQGYPVVDGDLDDNRPNDGEGVIVHLYPKGRAQSLKRGGFVRPFDFFEPTEDLVGITQTQHSKELIHA